MKCTRGFTLIEVMVALIILCLISLAFSHVLAFIIKTRDESQFLKQASLMAQLFVEDQRDLSQDNSSLYRGGEWDRFSLRDSWQNLDLSPCHRELMLCRVTIEWDEGYRVRSYTLSTLLLEGE